MTLGQTNGQEVSSTRLRSHKSMWVKGRQSIICLPKASAVCNSVRSRVSSPLAQVQSIAFREEVEFILWLRTRGEHEACSAVTVGSSLHGRGLFALRPIQAGERILRISKNLIITPDKLHDEVKNSLHSDINNCARLALVILAEQHAGQASEWAPYVSCLPQPGALHNTVLAERDYSPGEHIFINYGKFGNDVLSVTFGFTIDHNPFDQVEVWMGLSQRDVLRKEKLQLLHSHGMPTLPDIRDNDGGGNAFLIKEVKSVKGRGKGIPQSLRAFARVLCADSEKELADMAREALQTDGRLARRPLENRHRELQAIVLLLARVESLIQEHVTAILALQVEEYCRIDRKPVPPIRRKMAQAVLSGELRVLYSAANWFKNHCMELNSFL